MEIEKTAFLQILKHAIQIAIPVNFQSHFRFFDCTKFTIIKPRSAVLVIHHSPKVSVPIFLDQIQNFHPISIVFPVFVPGIYNFLDLFWGLVRREVHSPVVIPPGDRLVWYFITDIGDCFLGKLDLPLMT